MSNRLKLGLIAVVLAIVAAIATVGSLLLIHMHYGFLERRVPPPTHPLPGDFELFYVANAIISTINIALLVILIVIYVNIYVKTRSPFTIGLIIFAVVFLVRDLTSSPFITALYGFRAYGLGPFAFLPSLFELVALSVLLYLSVRY
ncbi:MAG TPA: hypothetical protein VK536_02985 [Candidatus Limnocylindrales bacterium]|nr:hypothetical protein [Candidatus Limnocylindrales bacterium]